MCELFILVIGNIGTGKTTFIKRLNKRENRITIFNDDYKNVEELNSVVLDSINKFSVILLEGLYTSCFSRSGVISPLKIYFPEIEFLCIDFGSGNKFSLNNRKNNPTFDLDKIEVVHEKNKLEYDMPILDEGFKRIIKCY
jgi:GTPase SAR1 family protein